MIATTLIGAVYLFGPEKAESTEQPAEAAKTKELTEEEMIQQLASKGYVVHTEEEWNNQKAAANNEKNRRQFSAGTRKVQ
ncbi:hypothetical protein [Bacillus sp. SG-1]|uniref:hypothetical protein n=1 Tax=Bacillus sp. SG-1 TaxID=161544 RepID=UPI0001544B96|nr:hypothetical protein [Bacillus sp. SG-1]EDL62465.1 hypothetical protein BSG1_06287 [Bacillus sp. SG-1]